MSDHVQLEAADVRTRDKLVGAALCATSGAAVLAHAFGPLPMKFAVPFVALPAGLLVAAVIMVRSRLHGRLRLIADLALVGGAWGFVATLCYDGVRLLLKVVTGFQFQPFKAMPIFGHFMTGLPYDDPWAITAGWLYHFWNGISFGIMFALLWSRGGIAAGLVWGLVLQSLMMAAYPHLLKVVLYDGGFLGSGFIGHGLWGLVLGAGVRWSATRSEHAHA